MKLDSFAGSCTVHGTSSFSPPATIALRPIAKVEYEGPGTCIGMLDGTPISNASVHVRAVGPADPGSCLEARTASPWPAVIVFPGGVSIKATLEFSFLLTEGTITYHGQYSGSGHGHGSFVTSRTQPIDLIFACGGAGGGVTHVPLDISLITDSPLVSDRSVDPGVPASEFSVHFSTQRTAKPTAAQVHLVVHRKPGAKPSPLRSEVIDLPPGARFHGSALPACKATDLQLQLLGRAACPAASEVGTGTISVITGFGPPLDPTTADVTIFNWGRGTIELVSLPGTNVTLAIDRGTFTAPGQLTNHPPSAPGGPPDLQTSVSGADLTYTDTSARGGAAFITTPPSCPATAVWTSRVAYSTADGRSYLVTNTTRCQRPLQPEKLKSGMRRVKAKGRARSVR